MNTPTNSCQRRDRARLWAAAGLSLFAATAAWAQSAPATEPAPSDPAVVLEKFQVTGTRLTGAAVEGSLSVSLYKMDTTANSGYSNFGELLRKKLPQFGGGVGTVNEAFGNGGTGAATISLRNLPISSTLFLIDGRRTNIDINQIPNLAIDRIEVLNDGASAVYGSDAVAGVVNVILKRHYEGAQLTTRYANTTDTDVGEWRAGLVLGAKAGRTSLMLALEHSERNILMTPDRAVSIPAGDSVSGTSNPGLLTPNSTAAQRLAANATVAGDAGHVAGVTNVNVLVPLRWFVDTPGTALTTAAQVPGAFNPVVFLTLPSTMSVTARNSARDAEEAARNAALPSNSPVRYGPNKVLLPGVNPGFPFGYFTYAIRPAEFTGLNLTTDTALTDNLSFFLDLRVDRNESANALAASPLSGRTVPTTNYWYQQVFPAAVAAGNSFGFGYRPTEIGSRITYNKFEDATVVAGFKGTLDGKWNWQVGYLRDEGKLVSTQTGGVLTPAFNAALAAGTAATAFNPFSFTELFASVSPGNPAALINSFAGSASSYFRAKLEQADVNVSGEVWTLPAGPVAAAVSAEYRKEVIDTRHDSALLTGGISPFNVVSPFFDSREIVSYSAELNVPVLRRLSLSFAGRMEEFDDVGSTGLKPRVSFRWEPLPKELTIRGSWAQGFIAPTPNALSAGSPTQSFQELFNPVTGIRTQPTQGVILIGNPGLQPEESDSYLVGVVWSPKRAKGLTVGVNYYRIEQTNIPFTSAQYIVNQWFDAGPTNAANPFGPGAAASAQNPLAARVILNVDGSLNQVQNVGPINSGARLTDGLDFFGSYLFSAAVGDFTLEASWTKVMTFEQENFPGAGTVDYLGYYWPSGSALGNFGFPVWKGSTSLEWKKGRFSGSVGYNYTHGYTEINTTASAADDVAIPSYGTIDLRLGWRIPRIEASLMVGVNNVADTQPPRVASSFENQYDRAIGDIRGRVVFVELSKKF
jgi:iron complex outermembrane receptor protein